MSQPQGIQRAGFLSSSVSRDGVLHSISLKGGFQEMVSVEERNSIPLLENSTAFPYNGFTASDDHWSSGRRRVGMLVNVLEENKFYQLIPVGFFGNAGNLGEAEWLALSEWERALRIDPTGSYTLQAPTPGNNFTSIVKTASDIGITADANSCWVELEIRRKGDPIDGHIIPDANETYDLGSPDKKFRDLYLSGNTLYMGGQPLSIVNGQLTLNGTPVTGSTDTKYSKGQTIGTNYPIYRKDFITDLYSIPTPSNPALAKYSKNEKMLAILNLNDIEFHQIDLTNNSSFLLASISRSIVMPNYKDNGTISKISYTGAFALISYRDTNNEFNWVILNVVGNQVNIIPNPNPAIPNSYWPAEHADYFINNDATSNTVDNDDHIIKKWDGTNWIDYQVFSLIPLYGNTPVYASTVKYASDNIVILHVSPLDSITPNHIYILRFDGTNWNIEYNINNCLSAYVALSPNENTFIYINENYEFITLKYQSSSWNTINTMQLPVSNYDYFPLSISVNEDRITLLDDIWQWDGSQWIKTDKLIEEDNLITLYGGTGQYIQPHDSTTGAIFSRSDNSTLIIFGNSTYPAFGASSRITIPNNILQYAQYQFSYNMLASPTYKGAKYSNSDGLNFWTYLNPGNPHTYDKETVEFKFEDTLSYVTGESVIMHSDNYELVLRMQVVNNDIPSKTLTLSSIETLKASRGIFTTYNIQPHS